MWLGARIAGRAGEVGEGGAPLGRGVNQSSGLGKYLGRGTWIRGCAAIAADPTYPNPDSSAL